MPKTTVKKLNRKFEDMTRISRQVLEGDMEGPPCVSE